MATPFLDGDGDAVYLTDDEGTRWRIHDVLLIAGHPRRFDLGAPHATTRVFVAPDGTRRVYSFGDDTRRELDLETLVDQLGRAR